MPPRSTPRVTIITIFLNAEAFLAEAIDSVLAQSFPDWELLLCDDGSTDGGTALARRYAAEHPGHIRYLEHEGHANRGMSATRNHGLGHARGDLIAFIDADDVWVPGKLAEQVAIMDGHPGLAMVCGTVLYWSSWSGGEDVLIPTGHALDRVVAPPEAMLALYPLGKADAPCPSDLLLSRDVVESVGRFEEHFTGPRQMYEDQAFLAKIYLEHPVWFSSSVWLHYRQHEDSCVAEVTSSGRYDEVRSYFLTWLEGFIAGRTMIDARVRAALAKALRRYRRPRLDAALTLPCRLAEAASQIPFAARIADRTRRLRAH